MSVAPKSVTYLLPREPGSPLLTTEALIGLPGDVVAVIGPHTEADPVAILVQFLLVFGNVIGSTAHFTVEAAHHFAKLFAVLVGAASRGRKGTSLRHVNAIFSSFAPEWAEKCITGGITSGEGLVAQVQDSPQYTIDNDKRLLIVEGEFGRLLRAMRRSGSTLSHLIREAWDDGVLRVTNKNSPLIATDSHISMIGHVTLEELSSAFSKSEFGNGFCSRCLWVWTTRARLLPNGGTVPEQAMSDLRSRVHARVEQARTMGEIPFTPDAEELWKTHYAQLTEGKTGLVGNATARSEAQCHRLAMIYALLDGAPGIDTAHLNAALALWKYCEESAHFIFTGPTRNTEDTVLRALDAANDGMSRTQINNQFQHHLSSAAITEALSTLEMRGVAYRIIEPGRGRPTERWFVKDAPQGTQHLECDLTSGRATCVRPTGLL